MKKTLLLLSLAAGSLGAHAQSPRFGMKAGVSLTNFTPTNNDYKFGFHGGLLADFGISRIFSIHPELLYSMKGEKFASFDNATQTMHYIDLPVLARIQTKGFFFEAGPQLGVLVAASFHGPALTYFSMPSPSYITSDNKSQFNSVDLGYVAGVGYQLASGPGLGVRYNGGLTKISDSGIGRNIAFQLYLSYLFGSK